MSEKIYDPEVFIELSKSLQRSLRWVSIGSFAYAISTFVGFYFNVMSWITILASCSASVFVYYLHFKMHGHITKWWWLRRGVFLTVSKPEDIEEAEEWTKEMFPGRYFMPNSYCFKFYNKSDAVAFKLVWC